jgi:tripartite-type tricarboxylate transporter receptor subunit TctC
MFFFIAQALLCYGVQAQTYPSRPITILVPYQAGGGPEVMLRTVLQQITDSKGIKFVVENRPGGAGVAGAVEAKNAAPDGYTLFWCDQGTFAANVAILKNLPYAPLSDFKPILKIIEGDMLLVTPPSLGVKSVADLARLAREIQGGLTYASQGTGTGGHFGGAMFANAVGVEMVHIPYKSGGSSARPDLLSGRVDFMFNTPASFLQDIQTGKLNALAVASKQRSAKLPDVPTMTESGYPSVDVSVWFGIAAPAGLDDRTASQIREMFTQALQTPKVQQALDVQAFRFRESSPKEMADEIVAQTEQFRTVAKANNIAP